MIAIMSAVVLARAERAGADDMRIRVTAQQFAWHFEYPNGKTSGTLYLPVDETVVLDMTARDVIHSFFVPQFGQKKDVVPGIRTGSCLRRRRSASTRSSARSCAASATRSCARRRSCCRSAHSPAGSRRAAKENHVTVVHRDELSTHDLHPGPAPRPSGLRAWLVGGWLRAIWMTPLFAGIGVGLVVGIRAIAGWEPLWYWPVIITVGFLTAAPSASWPGSGRSITGPTTSPAARRVPRTTPVTARYSWKDYFRVNTDHKVIGVQYVVTTIFFFLVGGLLAMFVAPSSRGPECSSSTRRRSTRSSRSTRP